MPERPRPVNNPTLHPTVAAPLGARVDDSNTSTILAGLQVFQVGRIATHEPGRFDGARVPRVPPPSHPGS